MQPLFNVTMFPNPDDGGAACDRVYLTVGPAWDPLTISGECRSEGDVDREYALLLAQLRGARDKAKAALRGGTRP